MKFLDNIQIIEGRLQVGTTSLYGLDNNLEVEGNTYLQVLGVGNENPSHLLTLGQSGNQGGLSIYGTNSGYVYLKTKDDAGNWTASLPDNGGNLPDYIINNFGGETLMSNGDGDLTFGTTPSLSLSEGYVFIGNTWSYAVGRTFSGDVTVDYTGTVTINDHVVSYNKMQIVSQKSLLGNTNISGGPVTEVPIYDSYIAIGSVSNALEDDGNWTGVTYSGPSITGTFQDQKHYDGSYYYVAVDDNLWIRLTRG
jgi:hypothetical protein